MGSLGNGMGRAGLGLVFRGVSCGAFAWHGWNSVGRACVVGRVGRALCVDEYWCVGLSGGMCALGRKQGWGKKVLIAYMWRGLAWVGLCAGRLVAVRMRSSWFATGVFWVEDI